jgi:hypothetical protein
MTYEQTWKESRKIAQNSTSLLRRLWCYIRHRHRWTLEGYFRARATYHCPKCRIWW